LFTAGNKPATVFETGTEMQGLMARNKKGTVDKQIYSNIRISLRNPDPNFGGTIKFTTVNGKKAKADRVTTTDNGKTWTIRQIVIPAMNPRPGTVNERLASAEERIPSERTPLEEPPEPEWTLDAGDATMVQTKEGVATDALVMAEAQAIVDALAIADAIVTN
jgi:hypothetical protein